MINHITAKDDNFYVKTNKSIVLVIYFKIAKNRKYNLLNKHYMKKLEKTDRKIT